MRDVVAHTLAQAGSNLIDLPLLETVPDHPIVAVLVEPREEHWLMAQRVDAQIVAVATAGDDAAVIDLIIQGADAVVTADCSPEDLADAVDIVGQGGSVLPPRAARNVLRQLRSASRRWRATLTPRERDILESIERGESIKQTARGLGISEKTVQNLQSRLFSKLQARNRAQAITRAHELSLL